MMKTSFNIDYKKVSLLLVITFALLLVVIIPSVSAIECGAIPTEGCTISVNTTFDTGTYLFNGSANGAIQINGLPAGGYVDCNNSIFIGNWSTSGNNGFIGINLFIRDQITLKNCNLVNYNYGLKITSSNATINNVNINGTRMGIYLSLLGLRGTINNSVFYNNSYASIWFNTASDINTNISNNIFYNYGDGIRVEPNYNVSYLSIDNNQFIQLGTNIRPAITQGISSDNWRITNNILTGNNVIYADGFYIIGTNTYLAGNTLTNNEYNIHTNLDATNVTIVNNTLKNGDIGSAIRNAHNIYIYNNTFSNMSYNQDSYNIGIQIQNSTNIYLDNNNFTLTSTVAILAQQNYNISITNNKFDFVPLSQRNKYLSVDGGEPRCALQLTQRFKGYFNSFGNSNVTISGNTFDSTTPCYLQSENSTQMTNDLPSNWYTHFSTNIPFAGNYEIFIPNYYNNLSRYSGGIKYDIRIADNNMDNYKYIRYNLSNTYLFLDNWNDTTTFTTTVYNLTNPTIYNGIITSGSSITNSQVGLAIRPGNKVYLG